MITFRWPQGRAGRGALTGAALAVTAAVLGGCATAQLTNVWQDPDFSGARMKTVLVASQRRDATNRRLWEDAMRAELEKDGVRVALSYDQYPDAPATQAQIRTALESGDVQGVVIERPLVSTTETRYVPGWSSIEPREYYNPWSNRGVVVYRERYHRGYHVVDRTAREQITVWSGDDPPKMVWAGTIEIENPSSSQDVRHDLSKALAPGLKKAGLI
jgi:hypothetical protein